MATITLTAPAARRPAQRASRTAPAIRSGAGVSATRTSGRATAAATGAAGNETLVLERPSVAAPVRLTLRGRRLARTVVVTLALLVALLVSVLGHSAPSQADNGPAVAATSTVVVQPGQTLWSIARGLSVDADLRETVARIQELNGLSGAAAATVRPGQSLVVPVTR